MHLRKPYTFVLGAAILLASTLCLAEGAPVSDVARQHFKAGIAYLEEPTGAKYEEAYREFHAAYDATPSYKILNNIAVCALYLERDGEAIDAYDRYLAAAPKEEIPVKKRAQLDSDLKRLKAGVVHLTLKVTPENATIADERLAVQGNNLINRYAANHGEVSLGIHPGTHRITVSAEGYAPQTWEVEASPASSHEREFHLKPISDPTQTPNAQAADAHAPQGTESAKTVTLPPKTQSAKTPTSVYVGAIATGVFAATATTMGLLSLSKKQDLETLNDAKTDHAAAESARSDAKRFALFCDIGLGATAIAAGATAYFYFSRPKTESTASNRRVHLTPVLGKDITGASLQGSF